MHLQDGLFTLYILYKTFTYLNDIRKTAFIKILLCTMKLCAIHTFSKTQTETNVDINNPATHLLFFSRLFS